jgi:dephospho-CoA kinase
MHGYRVGLTGGVGSGKSTVASMLGELGAGLVDADQLVHELVAPAGAAIAELREAFGPSAIAADGGLDRARMRARAFSDADARHRLEGILHPRVRHEAERRARALAAEVPYIVLVVPLLIESGSWTGRVQRVLVVDCAETTQLERVMARPGIDRSAAMAIIRAQTDRTSRLAAADDVLFNEAPIADVRNRVARLHTHYVRCAADAGECSGV